MKKVYIYRVTNMVNGKVYIGQTRNLSRRWGDHKRAGCDFHFHRAIRKHGAENFKFEVIDECLSSHEADLQEVYFIKESCSHRSEYGYNKTLGGTSIVGFSDESIAARRGREVSLETRKKLAEASRGFRHSEETKDLLRKKATGRKVTEETKRKLAESGLGRKQSEETRRKKSAALKGRKFSPETIERLRAASLKRPPHTDLMIVHPSDRVKIVELLRTGVPMRSLARDFGCSLSTIQRIKKKAGAI